MQGSKLIMYKYVKFDENSGLCTEVGTGTNANFYKSIGMVRKDVEQSEIDGNWYLTSKCPHYTEEEKEAQKELEEQQKAYDETQQAINGLKDDLLTATLMGDEEWIEDLKAEYAELTEEE
jgi:hypothetical protein